MNNIAKPSKIEENSTFQDGSSAQNQPIASLLPHQIESTSVLHCMSTESERKHGSVTIGRHTVGYRSTVKLGREMWVVTDYRDGRRVLRSAPCEEKARALATAIARDLCAGRTAAKDINAADAIALVEAKRLLAGRDLLSAVRYYTEKMGCVVDKTCKQVVDDFLTLKRSKGLNVAHVDSVKARLYRLTAAHAGEMIHAITVPMLEDLITRAPLAPRSKNHMRTSLNELFSWAEARNFIPSGSNPIAKISTIKVVGGEIDYVRLDEVTRLMASCPCDLVSYVALGLWAGLRPEETLRIQWQHAGDDFIRVLPRVSKTGVARLIPVQPNLREWLRPHRKATGPVVEASRSTIIIKLTRALGRWSHDILRHTFGTMRRAQTQDISKTAEEMGNGTAICRRHYANPMVTQADGTTFFQVAPTVASNVINL